MPRQVLLTDDDGTAVVLTHVAADNEAQLQAELMKHPQLLPLDDLGLPGGPALVVGRESTLDAGRVDLLLLARTGDLLLVEFKTGPQNPDFRAALAQLLDYGSDLWGMTIEEFDTRVVIPYLTGPHHPSTGTLTSLEAAVAKEWGDQADDDAVSWNDRLATQLRDGAFQYVTVAQRFTPSMLRTLQYLNATSKVARFSAVELVRFAGGGREAFEARVVAAAEAPTSRPQAKAALAGVDGLVAAITNDEYRHALIDFFEGLAGVDGLAVFWGTSGCSLRVPVPGRSPLSVGWIFPPGAPSWMGLTDVTLGWDEGSQGLVLAPNHRDALEAYRASLTQIAGGVAPKSPLIQGRVLAPPAVVAHGPQALAAVATVAAALQEPASGPPVPWTAVGHDA